MSNVIGPEDYAEPRCLLCDEPYGAAPTAKCVPQGRIIEKMDEYMSRRDYAGAERHLLYWLEEAQLGQDKRGELLIRNELIGHFRKTGNKEKAFENIEKALLLLEELDFADTVSGGTTYVNAATACNAFNDNMRAVSLFEKAEAAYLASSGTPLEKLGGLYNNMALTLAALKDFDRALEFYGKALEKMERVEGGELECAITCLNMADLYNSYWGAERAEDKTEKLLDKAYSLLTQPQTKHDGYYAFVCEKCAPSFEYYGYFMAANELKKRAKEIYERA